jgi:hypothetical protein
MDRTYQPDVYNLAYHIAKNVSCKYIIDIGSGDGLKLKPFECKKIKNYKIIVADISENEGVLKQNVNGSIFLHSDFEHGLPAMEEEWIQDSVVIFSDVIEHIVNPDILLRNLSCISEKCHAMLISTPERDIVRGFNNFGSPRSIYHVREWNMVEFQQLLNKYKFSKSIMGLTIDDNISKQKNTILALTGKIVYSLYDELVDIPKDQIFEQVFRKLCN